MPTRIQTGILKVTTLIEISGKTGLPTGVEKPNIPSDPDFIPPTVDAISCPVGTIDIGDFNEDFNEDYDI
jgi:hypothetical protein